MNIKNKNGVTITVLVITIIVMLILFGITFTTSTDLLRNSQRSKMKTMLYMVKSRGEILLDDYLFENDGKTTAELNAIPNSTIQEALKGTYIDTGSINVLKNVGYESGSSSVPEKASKIYCSWGEETLKSQGIDTKNLAKGDTIIVQYDIVANEVDVASTKGYSKDGRAIHSLVDF